MAAEQLSIVREDDVLQSLVDPTVIILTVEATLFTVYHAGNTRSTWPVVIVAVGVKVKVRVPVIDPITKELETILVVEMVPFSKGEVGRGEVVEKETAVSQDAL